MMMHQYKFYLLGVISTELRASSEEEAREMLRQGRYIAKVDEVTDVEDADLCEIDGERVQ